jgi:hypothetical protein
MHSFISRGLSTAGIALLLLGCSSGEGAEDLGTEEAALTAPTSVPSFSVLGSGRLTMGDRAQVTGGNLGLAGGAVNGANSVTLGLDSRVGVGNGLIGRRIVLNQRTFVGDLFVTQLVPQGGTFASQSAFSTPPAPPPIGTVSPGTTSLTVNSGQTVTLAAANRGQVTVNGTLRLSGGLYQFQNLNLGNGALLQPTAPSIVRVAGRVVALDRARIVPATGLNASAMRLIVAGANDTTGGVSFGNDAQLTGLVVSRASFSAGARFVGSGAIGATNVTFASDLRFTHNTGFACNSNAGCDDGNPCTTDTCTDAQCLHPAVANGTACPDDGNACTNDRCTNGACTHPNAPTGTTCGLPNASASCTAGTCGIDGCNAGFGDCDVDPANGCEHNVLSDESNCGQCGAACFVSNGVAACANGLCTDDVIQCFDQFEDCDLDGTNGCETDVLADESNCGQCGAACFVSNGVAACADGTCTDDVLQCFGDFGDCDLDGTNGCETDLLVDESNCGQCGAACFAQNGVNSCEGGLCTDDIILCFAGYGDCDLNPVNGCEAPLNTLTNCGDCGSRCTFPNGVPSCDTGTCGGTCQPGYSDCDGNAANGCETNLLTTCNTCGPPSAGCQYGNDCQEMHPDIVFRGSTVGRTVTLSGYANKPNAQITIYALGPQNLINPATGCDLAAADPAGDPDPTHINHYNWRFRTLGFSASTQAFPGIELYPWTLDVTPLPADEPSSEQQRWPQGGIARLAIQSLKFSSSGVSQLDSEAAAFETGCVTAANASQSFASLVEACGSASFRTACNSTLPPSPPELWPVQILTLVDGSPEKLPTPPETFCSGSTFSLGHYLNRRLPNLSPNCNATAYENSGAAYYQRIGAPPVDDFQLWLARAKQPGVSEVAVNYYNSGDLGVGREMHCWQNPSSAATRIACYVTNHLPAVFAPSALPPPGPDSDAEEAVNNAFENEQTAATVAMEYVPSSASDPVRFFVFDGPNPQTGVQPRLNRVGLDTDPEAKSVPGLCLACHGGDAQPNGSVPNANFLPFDNCAFSFSTVYDTTPTSQEEGFRQLNQLVLATHPEARGGTGIVELINGLYDDAVNTPGAVQNPNYLPASWQVTPAVANAYHDVVKPYCRSCHVARQVALLQPQPSPAPTPPAALGFPIPNRMLGPLAFSDMCNNHTMPHAQQTLRRFWGGSARAAVARARNTVALAGNTGANPPIPTVVPGPIVCSP